MPTRSISTLSGDQATSRNLLRLDARHGSRLSDAVASMVLAELTSGALSPGDKLPPERELATHFGVSRTVIREATRALVSRGAVVVRPGAGAFAAQVDPSIATESLRMLLHSSPGMTYEKVHEVRQTIEGQVASLAAARALEPDLDGVKAALRQQDRAPTGEAFAVADGEFHVALAAAAHNELFGVIVRVVGDLMVEVRRRTAYVPGARRRVIADHKRIAQAVARHDATAAQRAMADHLENARAIVRDLDVSATQGRETAHPGGGVGAS
jgi:GntR family transcriptional repressor for pyruvate dehydrogenase complex